MRSGLLLKLLAVGVPVAIVLLVGAIVVLSALLGGLRVWLRMRAASASASASRPAVDLWAHGAYGLWTGMEDSASWSRERARESLASWYGAKDGASFGRVIDDLARGTTGNPAWDQVRAVDLVRIGLAAGFLDVPAARARVRTLATGLRKTYRSWEALAAAFEEGMAAWHASRNITAPSETGRVQRNLPALREAVWPRIAWDAKL